MFEYLPEKRSFTIKLGQIIAHEIVKNGIMSKESRSIYDLNMMNRYDLAADALRKMPERYLVGTYTRDEIIKDMAMYIDERIPSAYAKWGAEDNYNAPSKITVSADSYGLIYHFEENRKKKNKAVSTKKQTLKSTEIEVEIEIEVTKSKDEQVKDANFVQVTQYLKKNGVIVEKQVLRAILFAVNGMTIYMQTKSSAIRTASKYFNVTQKSIKEHIDRMGIVSERALKTKSNFAKTTAKAEAISINQLEKRLAREK
ncbi:hypothetical protein [Bacillus thuringiensis]|uniref:hypothetical protein n=1 Tax=Bacillus thuringiensis TaxID=1428 RepID=UPI000BFE0900|nr:hypothetical protein [Bacillus thuringiensis]PGN45101.1 hypothetical protein CN968_06605 [Bacillus thuringiensis]